MDEASLEQIRANIELIAVSPPDLHQMRELVEGLGIVVVPNLSVEEGAPHFFTRAEDYQAMYGWS